ncbi:hypothetical protein ACJMK2_017271 [Sinanodonta woodiana]|uniref:LRAT domain-containing protein n=1 Tax=Sinanodonta woodiana TaxID=1069815 RepID=A0ABD3UWB4_SINWO
MSRQVKQPCLDDFKRNVQIGSHIALDRKKGSYTHHMLVTAVSNNEITVIEYGSPTDLPSLASVAFKKYLGIIQERKINIDELFGPNASSVFLVHCDNYPKTDEDRNSAVERARSRLGEKRYCLTCNNCEHFVTWALTGTPISEQWRDASAFCRCKADFLTALIPEVFSSIQLLLQKYIPNIKVFSQCLSSLKEKCLKYLPKGESFDKLRARISSIRQLDVLLVITISLFKIVAFCIEGGHSIEDHILEMFKIVGLQICFILGINPQLMEIVEKIQLWKRNLISTVDMRRELFKIIVSYLVILALSTYVPASIPFLIQVLGKSVITSVVSSVAGFVFDIVQPIKSKILSKLFELIKTIVLKLFSIAKFLFTMGLKIVSNFFSVVKSWFF